MKKQIKSINPATEEVLFEYETLEPQEAEGIATRVKSEGDSWRRRDISERAALLNSLARVLRERKTAFARIITEEMGKTIRESEGEVEKCAWTAEIYAENSEKWLAPEPAAADGMSHTVHYQPLGVILAVMPWNFPFWQLFRAAIPILTAGNSVVLKHASNVPRSALACESVFRDAGYPENLVRNLFADHSTIETLLRSDLIQGLTMTGSTAAGKKLAAVSGASLKKTVMELGGSDPYIVREDADIGQAAKNAVTGRFQNCGQSCIAAKRIIVHESVADEFLSIFTAQVRNLKAGDPTLPDSDMGPLVSKKALEVLEGQVEDAVEKGAKLLCGGSRIDRRGFFFQPAVLTDVNTTMRVLMEETFGPVAVVETYARDSEAAERANDSVYGLGGSIWTRDIEAGRKLAAELECGSVFINSITKSDPRMPIGGVKESGTGRELGKYGLREFTNIKGLNIYS